MSIIIIVCALALTPCGGFSRSVANLTGFSKECVDGIEYIQFTSGVTVSYSPEGKIKTCK